MFLLSSAFYILNENICHQNKVLFAFFEFQLHFTKQYQGLNLMDYGSLNIILYSR